MINFQGLSGAEAASKLDEVLHRNLANARQQVARVFEEQPVDRKVPAETVRWDVDKNGIVSMRDDCDLNLPMHSHAMQHAHNISGVPATFARRLREDGAPWALQLLEHNLNETWGNLRDKDGRPPAHLVRAKKRSVDTGGELGMAVLSASYKTIDTRPLLEAFLQKAGEHGAVPYQARGTNLQFAMKMVLPRVQMVNNDPYVFGLEYRNTDWGGTAAGLTAFMLRLACLNGMTTERVFRKVHLGAKLDRDADWSQATRRLEQETTVSAIGDMTQAFLLPERQESLVSQLAKAAETEVSIDKLENTLKGKVPARDVKRTVEIIQSADPRVPRTLGKGISWLDAAQALSAASQDVVSRKEDDCEDKCLDMERIAGKLMNMGAAA